MSGGWFPTSEQELLLHACLDPEEPALAAWEEWQRRVELDDVEMASFRLLPLLYTSLVAHGVDDATLGRVKGVYRHAWSRNQFHLLALERALSELGAEQIPTMLLKGAALLQRAYSSPAARPMDDVDVLVPVDCARRALGHLCDRGWKLSRPDGFPDSRFRLQGGANLHNGAGNGLDLHWYPLKISLFDADDFWQRAVEIEYRGLRTSLLSPAHELLLTLVHPVKWHPVGRIRWVADAVLLERASPVDWDDLLRQAEKRRVTLVVRAGLEYLRDAFAVPVPDDVIPRLARIRAPRFERRELETAMRQTGFLTGAAQHRAQYSRLSAPWPRWRRVAGFLPYLRDWWSLRSTWQVPLHAARKLVGR